MSHDTQSLQVSCMACHVSCVPWVMCHVCFVVFHMACVHHDTHSLQVSCLVCHAPCVSCVSWVICNVSGVVFHMSCVYHDTQCLQVSCLACHVPCVSCVMCLVSSFTSHAYVCHYTQSCIIVSRHTMRFLHFCET